MTELTNLQRAIAAIPTAVGRAAEVTVRTMHGAVTRAAQSPRHGSHVGATRTTSPTDEGQPVQAHAGSARGRAAARDDTLRRDLHTLANQWEVSGQPFAADDLRTLLAKARTTEETP